MMFAENMKDYFTYDEDPLNIMKTLMHNKWMQKISCLKYKKVWKFLLNSVVQFLLLDQCSRNFSLTDVAVFKLSKKKSEIKIYWPNFIHDFPYFHTKKNCYEPFQLKNALSSQFDYFAVLQFCHFSNWVVCYSLFHEMKLQGCRNQFN